MIRRYLAPLMLLLAGLELSRRGMAFLQRGGDFVIFGGPLLALGLAAAATGTASMLLGASRRRRVAMWMCLAAAVPFLGMALLIFRAPDHGGLGGLFIYPLLGGAALLVLVAARLRTPPVDAATSPQRGRLAFVLLGGWLGSVAISALVPLGGLSSGMSILRNGGLGEVTSTLLWVALSPPGNAVLIISAALHGEEEYVLGAVLLWGSIVAGGLLGARIWSIWHGPGPDRHVGRALIACGALVTVYAVTATLYFPLSNAIRRRLDSPDRATTIEVRDVATLSPAERRQMLAARVDGQYWDGFCCVEGANGARLAYVKHKVGPEMLYVDDRVLGRYAFHEQMGFSPDGRHFAYIAGTELGRRELFVDGEDILHGGGTPLAFAFSPDSRRLAYLLETSPAPHEENAVYVATLSDAAGTVNLVDQRLVTRSNSGIGQSLRFSPDARHLLFVEGPEILSNDQGVVESLRYILNVDGVKTVLAITPDVGVEHPIAWFASTGGYICAAIPVRDDAARQTTYTEEHVRDLSGTRVDVDYGPLCRPPIPRAWDEEEFEGANGHRARIAREGALMRLMVNDRPQPLYDYVWGPSFTDDGAEVRYGAVDRGHLVWIRARLETAR